MAIMDLDAVRLELPTYEAPLAELEKSLDVENKKRRVEELNLLMQEPGWNTTRTWARRASGMTPRRPRD